MKPILFSTPMVQAILDGRKTMTRRFVKTDGEYFTDSYNYHTREACFMVNGKSTYINYPFDVGDVLWVRETWQEVVTKDGKHLKFVYKTDGGNYKWKPSIFMPKEACRIFLRVTNVRVERLQDISVEDIKKEGAPLITITGNNEDFINSKLKGWWYDLWNSINGKGAWEDNPYVFVYEFERVEKPN